MGDRAVGTVIGGVTPAARNIIGGQINLSGRDTIVQGNYVGADITGSHPLNNPDVFAILTFGIFVYGTGMTIGGPTPPQRNILLGGVGGAIQFNGGGNHTVIGNFIGLAADGVTLIGPPGAIEFLGGASNVTIGGVTPGAGNIIDGTTGNHCVGITAGSTGISVRGNSMWRVRNGIDLGRNDRTPNDPGDIDSGPHNLQNFPLLNSVTTTGQTTTVSGTLDSTPSTTFTVDFYTNTACGQGSNRIDWVGTTTVLTDSTGQGSFTFTTAGYLLNLTATATDPGNNTSELSPCVLPAVIPTLSSFGLLLLGVALPLIAMLSLRR